MPRAAAVDIIRYASVRDPGRGINLAILTRRGFTKPEPVAVQTWRVHIRNTGVHALCEARPMSRTAFDRTTFAADPRIARMKWNRTRRFPIGRRRRADGSPYTLGVQIESGRQLAAHRIALL
jgi:hypothetical protein